jgi:pimeloyl-ACP methyl ester carboxylesterase
VSALSVRDGGGDGPAFVWAHGLTMSMATEDAAPGLDLWRELRDWRIVRYDARGHGASRGPNDPAAYRWEQLARDQLALLDDLGVGSAVLAGASMGTATALWSTVLAPERVRALVLVIPPTAWATRPAQARTYRTMAGLVSLPLAARFLRLVLRFAPTPPVLRGELAPLAQAMVHGALQLEPRRMAAIFRGAAESDLPPPEQLAAAVGERPVLVLAWAGDDAHPVSSAEALAGALADVELHVASTPAEVLAWPAVVADFLARRVTG